MSVRSRPRIGLWLGVLALLLHALVPLAPAWALDDADSATFPAACSLLAAEQPVEDGGAADPGRCPLCLAQGAGPALMPGPPGLPVAHAVPLRYAVPEIAADARPAAVARALPRGPPHAI